MDWAYCRMVKPENELDRIAIVAKIIIKIQYVWKLNFL